MNGTPDAVKLSARPYFDRTMTLYIKGIALLCMLVHHFFTWPERYVAGIDYAYIDLFARIFQAPTRICVGTFAFLTGYFYCFSKKKTLGYSLKKNIQLLVCYWVAYGFLLGLSLAGGFRFRLQDILMELLTLRKDLMVDSWYVPFYILAMLFLPLTVHLLPKNKTASWLVGLGVPVVVFTLIAELTPDGIARIAQTQRQWFPCIMSGYLAARNDLFTDVFDPLRDRLDKKWKKAVFGLGLMGTAMILRRFFYYGIFGMVVLTRNITFQVYMDVLYAPMFIYGAVTFLQQVNLPRWVHVPLAAIGKLSLPMWFAHGLFFGAAKELYQPIAFLPRNPILVLIWATLLTYGLAWCMDKVASLILRKR